MKRDCTCCVALKNCLCTRMCLVILAWASIQKTRRNSVEKKEKFIADFKIFSTKTATLPTLPACSLSQSTILSTYFAMFNYQNTPPVAFCYFWTKTSRTLWNRILSLRFLLLLDIKQSYFDNMSLFFLTSNFVKLAKHSLINPYPLHTPSFEPNP